MINLHSASFIFCFSLLFLTACTAPPSSHATHAPPHQPSPTPPKASTANAHPTSVPAKPATPVITNKPAAPAFPQGWTLIGKNRGDVKKLIGTPKFERQDDRALIWRYQNAQCLTELFFYNIGSVYTVRHVEQRTFSGKKCSAT
ncbi:MAG: hypothetical protein AAF442_01660 [Pseudomonadota bacterium]